ncbi:hypothetical protein WJX79_010439 [Trebouxia sp. C0005]
MSSKRSVYDEDDYDDYEDEDYYGDYGDFDPGESQVAGKQSAKTAAKVTDKNKSKSGNKAGKPQAQSHTAAPAAAQQKTPQARLAVPSANNANEIQRFKFDTPSPDDSVLEAQKRATGSAESTSSQHALSVPTSARSASSQPQNLAATQAITEDVARLHLHDHALTNEAAEPSSKGPPRPASVGNQPQRPIQEYQLERDLQAACDALASAEQAQPKLHLVVLGHVDAGKSTLMGRLLHDLGYVSQKAVHKHEKEAAQAGKASFSWAWLLDERPEERARGVTVDVATTRFQTSQRNVTLLDAPGHRDFVPNMIAGAAQADAALLLVDGSPGGFESGFEGSAGGGGQNLVKPPTEPELSWFKGPSVVAAINAFKPSERATSKPFRMPITDVFKGQRGGISVGGKLEGGAVKVGTPVRVMPSNEIGTVRSIEVDGATATLARAGDTADLTLAGVEPAVLNGGAVLCHPEWPVPLASRIIARLLVLDVSRPILRGQQVTLHAHASQETGHMSHLVSLLDCKTFEVSKNKPRCLLKGQSAMVEVTLSRTMCIETYKDYRALGRVAFRDSGRTIAVGTVIQVFN